MLIVYKDGSILYKYLVYPRILVSTRIGEPIYNKHPGVTTDSTDQALESGKAVCPAID